MIINIPVSVGELFDKISILEIKKNKLKNKDKIKIVKYELDKLNMINLRLWNIEDKKRKFEKHKKFDDKFIHLARNVYLLNDKRALIKLNINHLSGSQIKEVKSYEKY